MRIVVIDTATRRGTVAAVDDGRVLASRCHERQTAHAEQLFGMMDEVLAEAGWVVSQVELLAVGMGPGSFTGVRVGMAAAKGIGFSLGIPLVGVTSLSAMAHAARLRVGAVPVVAALDAKKGEVFLAGFDGTGACIGGPEHIARDGVPAWIHGKGVVAAVVAGEIAAELSLTGVMHVRGDECDLPGPGSMAALASDIWRWNGVDQIESLEPLYVRPPDITVPRVAGAI